MPILTERFERALTYAIQLHAAQLRKGSTIPYASHLLAVSGFVLEAGGDEDEAIAALLHDAVEDQGGLPTLLEIRQRFGERVAAIVEHCSDSVEVPDDRGNVSKGPWEERKRAYHAKLVSADRSSLLVSACDKLHNAQATLRDLRNSSDPQLVWKRFNASPEQTLWNYRSLLRAYETGAPDARREIVVKELSRAVASIEGYLPQTDTETPGRCPKCGSSRTRVIQYGLPAAPPDIDDVYLGGCVVGLPGMRQFGCLDCRAQFD